MKFLKEWWGIWVAPIAIAVFLAYPYIFYSSDDINAPAGWGSVYLQKILFALLIVIVGNELAWLIVKLDIKELSEINYSNLTDWQRSIYWLVYYSILLLSFVLAFQALGSR